MKKALVLGLGISGKSAVSFLEKEGMEVVAVDDKLLPRDIADISSFSLFVPSPGVPRTHPLYQRAKAAGLPIAGEAHLGLEKVKHPCIGVTGSNGKTTTVKMIEHCFNACGKKAKALGNVGDPLTNYSSPDEEEILVVELSSFQLETLKAKVFDLAFILNITENHLDRYSSFEEYAKTKADIQYCLKEGGKLILHRQVYEKFPSLFSTPFLPFDGGSLEAAIFALAHFGISKEAVIEAAKTFSPPPHRLEFVAKVDGVAYYNDSKATSVSAMLNGIARVSGKIILLAGGRNKGLSFDPLQTIQSRLSHLIAFGEAAETIATSLRGLVPVHLVKTVQEAVFLAHQLSAGSNAVLFSPGCASFDAFTNYEERGEEFKKWVKSFPSI